MRILGIETSCDETSAAVIEDGNKILSNIVLSQINLHKEFGGVVPEIAAREHLLSINLVVEKALLKAKKTFDDLNAIAVTQGPGLIGCLLIGISTAKSYSFIFKKPLKGINHVEAHLCSIFLEEKISSVLPFVGLVVSGGHTVLVYVKKIGEYKIIGKTTDDAAGEAFDKVAKILNLKYPGGPIIEKLAREGNELAINFPRARIKGRELDFSFSGLKTAVLNYITKNKKHYSVSDVAASFQIAVVDVLVEKTLKSAKINRATNIVIAGGVASNLKLQKEMKKKAYKHGIKVFCPSSFLCTDNAAMIASLGYYKLMGQKQLFNLDLLNLEPLPNWELIGN